MIRHEGAATKKLQFMLTTVFTLRGLTLTAGVTGVSLLGKKVKKEKREWARSPSWIFWIWWSNMCGVLGDCGLCERRLGEATMRRGSGVNGCDHSFLVNNAALLIGWINNWCGRVRGGLMEEHTAALLEKTSNAIRCTSVRPASSSSSSSHWCRGWDQDVRINNRPDSIMT